MRVRDWTEIEHEDVEPWEECEPYWEDDDPTPILRACRPSWWQRFEVAVVTSSTFARLTRALRRLHLL